MFFREPDASKVALVSLLRQIERWDFRLLDCQVMNPHLKSLGARSIPRALFLELLAANQDVPTRRGPWHMDDKAREPEQDGHAGRAG